MLEFIVTVAVLAAACIALRMINRAVDRYEREYDGPN